MYVKYLNLDCNDISYFYGFIQADGNFQKSTRNRGKLSIELGIRDKDILEDFCEMFTCNTYIRERERDTNYKEGYKSSVFSIYDRGFREELRELGMKEGSKKGYVSIPKGRKYSKRDYIRGYFDGDGSIGFTKDGSPYMSIVIVGEEFKEYYIEYVSGITGKEYNVNRNKRDNVYNILITREDAQKVIRELYYEGCLCMNRKKLLAEKVLEWKRPKVMRKRTTEFKRWTPEQDEYILNNTVQDSMRKLERSEKSVKVRLWRLKKSV